MSSMEFLLNGPPDRYCGPVLVVDPRRFERGVHSSKAVSLARLMPCHFHRLSKESIPWLYEPPGSSQASFAIT